MYILFIFQNKKMWIMFCYQKCGTSIKIGNKIIKGKQNVEKIIY